MSPAGPRPPPGPILIRPYRSTDRAAVRNLCGDTADAGEPLEQFFSDRDLVGDLVTRYYTDYESAYSWVAERDGQVVGYLTAAPDTLTFQKTLRWSIAPKAILHALGRGLLFKPSSWALAREFLRRRGRLLDPPFHPPAVYPAHLHINLAKPARGHEAGRRLMAALISKLKANHIPGVHATVRTDNAGGCAFFERLDFKPISYYHEILPAGKGVRCVKVTVYGRKVD